MESRLHVRFPEVATTQSRERDNKRRYNTHYLALLAHLPLFRNQMLCKVLGQILGDQRRFGDDERFLQSGGIDADDG